MKCAICGKDIEETFLGKIKGNHVKVNGKIHTVCNSCFKANKEDIKSKIKT